MTTLGPLIGSSGLCGFSLGRLTRPVPVPVAVVGSIEKAQVGRVGAAAKRMRADVVYLDQMARVAAPSGLLIDVPATASVALPSRRRVTTRRTFAHRWRNQQGGPAFGGAQLGSDRRRRTPLLQEASAACRRRWSTAACLTRCPYTAIQLKQHMNSVNSNSGKIRRIDAHLRSKYPHLRTRIFEVTVNEFQIQFDPTIQDALVISEDFDHSIRFIGVAATLTNDIPLTFLRELPTLTDSEATATMIGLPLSTTDLYNLLVSRFPDLAIVGVKARRAEYITICFCERPPSESILQVREFIDTLALSIEVRYDFQCSNEPQTLDSIPSDPLYVIASRLRESMPSYVHEDEAFWFNNIEAISTNQFDRRSFPRLGDGFFPLFP